MRNPITMCVCFVPACHKTESGTCWLQVRCRTSTTSLTSATSSAVCSAPMSSPGELTVLARGAMGRRIDPSWWTHWSIYLWKKRSYFSFQPVLHDWCNKGRGMCYPVCEMVHIKEPLLLIDKSSLCGGSRFPFSLSEWSLTICLTPYNRK